MVDSTFFLAVMVGACTAAFAVGCCAGRRRAGMGVSLLLGLAIAAAKIIYDPDPPPCGAPVAFPLMCYGVYRIGSFVHGVIRRLR